jgi:7-carboxy-7-deazaguanine synthase
MEVDMPKDKLTLAVQDGKPEVFYTVQGEGANLGMPSVFVRTSLCNLNCKWCDTPYTWDAKRFDMSVERKQYDLEEVADIIRQYGCNHVVFTGGEPLLQEHALNELAYLLRGFTFEFETNGTLVPKHDAEWYGRKSRFNVSVKLSGSGVAQERRIKPEAIRWHARNPYSVFKFVVASDDDKNEIVELVDDFNLNRERVYIMPEGVTVEDVIGHGQALVDFCMEHKFVATTRLHVLLFGGKRGT